MMHTGLSVKTFHNNDAWIQPRQCNPLFVLRDSIIFIYGEHQRIVWRSQEAQTAVGVVRFISSLRLHVCWVEIQFSICSLNGKNWSTYFAFTTFGSLTIIVNVKQRIQAINLRFKINRDSLCVDDGAVIELQMNYIL